MQETELQRYAIAGTSDEWAAAIEGKSAQSDGKILSVKRKKDAVKDIPWNAKKKDKKEKGDKNKYKEKGKKEKGKKKHSKMRLKGS